MESVVVLTVVAGRMKYEKSRRGQALGLCSLRQFSWWSFGELL